MMLWFKPKAVQQPLALEPPKPEPVVILEPLVITALARVTGKVRIHTSLKAELKLAFKQECEQQALRALTLEDVHRAQGAREAFDRFLNLVGEVKT